MSNENVLLSSATSSFIHSLVPHSNPYTSENSEADIIGLVGMPLAPVRAGPFSLISPTVSHMPLGQVF